MAHLATHCDNMRLFQIVLMDTGQSAGIESRIDHILERTIIGHPFVGLTDGLLVHPLDGGDKRPPHIRIPADHGGKQCGAESQIRRIVRTVKMMQFLAVPHLMSNDGGQTVIVIAHEIESTLIYLQRTTVTAISIDKTLIAYTINVRLLTDFGTRLGNRILQPFHDTTRTQHQKRGQIRVVQTVRDTDLQKLLPMRSIGIIIHIIHGIPIRRDIAEHYPRKAFQHVLRKPQISTARTPVITAGRHAFPYGHAFPIGKAGQVERIHRTVRRKPYPFPVVRQAVRQHVIHGTRLFPQRLRQQRLLVNDIGIADNHRDTPSFHRKRHTDYRPLRP